MPPPIVGPTPVRHHSILAFGDSDLAQGLYSLPEQLAQHGIDVDVYDSARQRVGAPGSARRRVRTRRPRSRRRRASRRRHRRHRLRRGVRGGVRPREASRTARPSSTTRGTPRPPRSSPRAAVRPAGRVGGVTPAAAVGEPRSAGGGLVQPVDAQPGGDHARRPCAGGTRPRSASPAPTCRTPSATRAAAGSCSSRTTARSTRSASATGCISPRTARGVPRSGRRPRWPTCGADRRSNPSV